LEASLARWLAGIAAFLLFVTGSVLAFQGSEPESSLPTAERPRYSSKALSPLPDAPEADPKSKEERRFGRADKNEDGRITMAEMVEPRRKAFAKIDVNSDGRLSFEEWSVKTITKFKTADADGDTSLSPAEYATTAPKPKKRKPACSC
jgi:hypothetical protein